MKSLSVRYSLLFREKICVEGYSVQRTILEVTHQTWCDVHKIGNAQSKTLSKQIWHTSFTLLGCYSPLRRSRVLS